MNNVGFVPLDFFEENGNIKTFVHVSFWLEVIRVI